MRGSTKTSVEPTTKSGRYFAIKHIIDGKIPLADVLEAAQQLQAARGEQPQPVDTTPAPTPWWSESLKRILRSAPAAESAKLDERWNEDVTRGPADLVRFFAMAALYEHKPELLGFDEKSCDTIRDAAEFAVSVALRLAGVSQSWTDEYRELTAYLHK
jgi:hypothetical protein